MLLFLLHLGAPTLHVLAEYEIITLERLKEVQAQAEATKVKVAEADALDAAVQLMEDFQVGLSLYASIHTTTQHISRGLRKQDIWSLTLLRLFAIIEDLWRLQATAMLMLARYPISLMPGIRQSQQNL